MAQKTNTGFYNTVLDRIEELEELLKAAQDDAKEAETYTEELEANLAKALSALEVGIAKHDGAEKFLKDARTTLAEIQGEQR